MEKEGGKVETPTPKKGTEDILTNILFTLKSKQNLFILFVSFAILRHWLGMTTALQLSNKKLATYQEAT